MVSKCRACGAHVLKDVALVVDHHGATYLYCSAQCADAEAPDIVAEIPALPRAILVAVDGSGPSVRAVENAAALARVSNGRLTLLAAIESDRVGEDARSAAARQRFEHISAELAALRREGAEGRLERCRRICERAGVPCKTLVETRPPLEAILAAAPDFDLVVMGSRGRDALATKSLGSLAQRVIAGTQKPVLVVH